MAKVIAGSQFFRTGQDAMDLKEVMRNLPAKPSAKEVKDAIFDYMDGGVRIGEDGKEIETEENIQNSHAAVSDWFLAIIDNGVYHYCMGRTNNLEISSNNLTVYNVSKGVYYKQTNDYLKDILNLKISLQDRAFMSGIIDNLIRTSLNQSKARNAITSHNFLNQNSGNILTGMANPYYDLNHILRSISPSDHPDYLVVSIL